jgi:nucleoid DNA-binding protein
MSSVYGQTLLDDMVQQQGLPMALVREAAREILAVIRGGLIEDGVVNVSNFGTFRLKPVAARSGFNPQTRERITIPAHQRVVFSPCKALREMIEPVHRPPIPIQEEKPAARAAARSAPIAPATAVATKTIVPPAAAQGENAATAETTEQPGVETARPSVESRLDALTEQASSEESEQPPVMEAGQSDKLKEDTTIQLELGEENATEKRSYNSLYLGAAAAIVIAAVAATIYFGDAGDEPTTPLVRAVPTPTPPSIQAETAMHPSATAAEPPPTAEAEPGVEYHPVPQVAKGGSSTESLPATAEPAASSTSKAGGFFFSEARHTISHGESLWRLARRHYKDPLLWPHIYQANAAIIDNPDNLRLGQDIVIPSLQGRPGKLTKTDRRNIAEGYYLTYLHYKKSGHRDAFFALLEAKRYDNKVVEEHRSLLQLSRVEEVLLGQQETMPF